MDINQLTGPQKLSLVSLIKLTMSDEIFFIKVVGGRNDIFKGDSEALPLERELMPPKIISVAQFRPEKTHSLQLQAFALSIKKLNSDIPRPKLQFVGSCRNDADEARLQSLKDLAIELKVEDDVEFYKNVTYRELVKLLGGATAGIHSMIDEHFGISVVEYMAVVPTILQIQDTKVLVGPKKEKLDVKVALSNSFGFGGHNSSILFAPFQ